MGPFFETQCSTETKGNLNYSLYARLNQPINGQVPVSTSKRRIFTATVHHRRPCAKSRTEQFTLSQSAQKITHSGRVTWIFPLKARIPFGHSREDWLPSVNLLLSFVTYSVKYFLSITGSFTWFHLILCNTSPFDLPYAKYGNCAHSEFFPNLWTTKCGDFNWYLCNEKASDHNSRYYVCM